MEPGAAGSGRDADDLMGPFSELEERIIGALMRLEMRRRIAVVCAAERRLRDAGTQLRGIRGDQEGAAREDAGSPRS